MIDVTKIAQFARMLEKVTAFLIDKGIPIGVGVKGITVTPQGFLLILKDGSLWEINLTLNKVAKPDLGGAG